MSTAIAAAAAASPAKVASISTAVPLSTNPAPSPLAPATWSATHIANIPIAPHSRSLDDWTEHEELKQWVAKHVALMKPERVYLCTGSEEENKRLLNEQVRISCKHRYDAEQLVSFCFMALASCARRYSLPRHYHPFTFALPACALHFTPSSHLFLLNSRRSSPAP